MADNSTNADDAAFLVRAMRYLEDDLSPQDTLALKKELETDARRRQIFVQICVSDTLVQEELTAIIAGNPIIDEHSEGPDQPASLHDTMVLPGISSTSAGEVDSESQPLELPKPIAARHPWPWRKFGGYAAVLLLALTAMFAFLSRHKAPMVARLSEVLDARWGGDSMQVGQTISAGTKFTLQSGCASFSFNDQTTAIVEGPAEITLTTGNQIELQSGKLCARMVHGHSGFTVITPDSKIVDLGTEFGVIVDPQAKSTDVHVFDGRVQVSATSAMSSPTTVVRGGLAHVVAGTVVVTPGGNSPQIFVRDISGTAGSVELADLISGGDGSTERRGVVIDPVTGEHGPWGTPSPWRAATDPADHSKSDGQYHRVTGLPVVDGTFVPDASGLPEQVDSANQRFTFPVTTGMNAMRFCVAGAVAPRAKGDVVPPLLGGINYAAADHSCLVLNTNAGITLDLVALRRIHPAARLASFHCTFGHYDPAAAGGNADLYLLIDGAQRFARRGFVFKDGALSLDVPLSDTDHFLTLAFTDSGDGTAGGDVLLGDAKFDLAAK